MVHTLLFDWRSLTGNARDELIARRDAYENIWGQHVSNLALSGVLRPEVNLGLLRFIGFGAGNWVATWFSPEGSWDSQAIADGIWACIAFGVVDPEFHSRYLPPK